MTLWQKVKVKTNYSHMQMNVRRNNVQKSCEGFVKLRLPSKQPAATDLNSLFPHKNRKTDRSSSQIRTLSRRLDFKMLMWSSQWFRAKFHYWSAAPCELFRPNRWSGIFLGVSLILAFTFLLYCTTSSATGCHIRLVSTYLFVPKTLNARLSSVISCVTCR